MNRTHMVIVLVMLIVLAGTLAGAFLTRGVMAYLPFLHLPQVLVPELQRHDVDIRSPHSHPGDACVPQVVQTKILDADPSTRS